MDPVQNGSNPTEPQVTPVVEIDPAQQANPTPPTEDTLAALQSKLKQARQEAAENRKLAQSLKEQLKAFEGIDVNDYKSLKEKQSQLEKQKLIEEGKFNEYKETLNKEFSAKLEAKEAELKELSTKYAESQSDFDNMICSIEISKACQAAKAHNPSVMEKLLLSEMKVIKTEEGRQVIFVDKNGNERYSELSTNKLLTIKERIEELKASPDHAFLFQGITMGAGSGNFVSGTGFVTIGGKSIPDPFKPGQENLTAQMQLFRENPALYEKLNIHKK